MEVYWTMKTGKKINVDHMDVNHLRNSLKMVIRQIDQMKIKSSKKPKELHLNGEIANQMFEQMLIEEYENEDYYDFLP